MCVFRRRKTEEHGHRGFRLSSLGVLLAPAPRPRPWRHVRALKALVHEIYTTLEDRAVLEPTDSDWAPARAFFEARRAGSGSGSAGGAGEWRGWDAELGCAGSGTGAGGPGAGANAQCDDSNPTVHLPHLLQVLGPSCLTLYKHVLGRRRVLIYTLPPVEAACVLCQVAADLCYEEQIAPSAGDDLLSGSGGAGTRRRRLKGRSKESVMDAAPRSSS